MSPPRNLVNLNGVHKEFSTRTVLGEVTVGVAAGERIGVVGRNGEGKSTLLRLLAGAELPDTGVLTRAGDLGIAMLAELEAAMAERERLEAAWLEAAWLEAAEALEAEREASAPR